jgi:hypothetical protein
MLESVRAATSCSTSFITSTPISDFSVDVTDTAGANTTKNLVISATGCSPPSSLASFTWQVLEYDTWSSLTSSSFDENYTSYFSFSGSGLTRTLTYRAPDNSLMKKLPEKVFKFKLTATANFSNPNNCGNGNCYCSDGINNDCRDGNCGCP